MQIKQVSAHFLLVTLVVACLPEEPGAHKQPGPSDGKPSHSMEQNFRNLVEEPQPYKLFKDHRGQVYELYQAHFSVECRGDYVSGYFPFLAFWLRTRDKTVWTTVKNAFVLASMNHAASNLWEWTILVNEKGPAKKGVIFCYRPASLEVAQGPDAYAWAAALPFPDYAEVFEFWEFDPSQEMTSSLPSIPIKCATFLNVKQPKEVNPGESYNLTELKRTGKLVPVGTSLEAPKPKYSTVVDPNDPFLPMRLALAHLALNTKPIAVAIRPRKTLARLLPEEGEKPPFELQITWNQKEQRWEVYYDQYKLIREGPNKWRAEKVQK